MNIKKYEKLLKQKAFSFACWFGCSPCSIEDQIRDLFIDAMQSYKKEKGASFATWLNRVLYNGMIDYIKQQQKYSKMISEDIYHGEKLDFDSERRIIFLNALEKLSDASQYIIIELFKGTIPIEYEGSYKNSKGIIRKWLIEQGWKADNIRFSFNEISTAVRQMGG